MACSAGPLPDTNCNGTSCCMHRPTLVMLGEALLTWSTRVKHTRWCLEGSPRWKVRVTSVVPQSYWPPAEVREEVLTIATFIFWETLISCFEVIRNDSHPENHKGTC